MTLRYLEGMASGCLLLGHAPAELLELAGFNPVVEVDWDAPDRQVRQILKNPGHWQPHVDRALKAVRAMGDWSVRVCTLRTELGL
jgi:hypothetical protein